MPVVPRDQRQVEIGQAPGPAPFQQYNGSAPAEAFGGGAAGASLGKSFQGLGQTVEGAAEKIQRRANDSALEGLDLEASQEQTRIEIEAKKLKGRDAKSGLDYADQEWKKVSDRLSQKASNEEQRAAIAKLLNGRYATLDRTLQLHAASQIEVADKVQHEAYQATLGEEAIRNRDDPERVKESMGKLYATVERHLALDGITDEASVKAKQQEVGSATNLAIVKSFLDSDDPYKDTKAKAYYEAHKDEFIEKDRRVAFEQLKTATMVGESQRQADQIYASSKDEGEAMQKVMALSGELRDKTEARVKDLFSMKKLVDDRKREDNYRQADMILGRTGDTDRIPPALWNSFSASEQEKLKEIARHKREGTQPVTNWTEYYNLKTMAASPQLRSNFMRINLLEYRTRLADTEFKELVNAQDGLRKGDDKTQKLLDGVRTDQEIVNSAIKKAGYDPNSKDDAVITETSLLRKKIDDQVIALQERTGHKVTSKELEEITDKLIIEGRTEKRTFLGIDWLSRDTRKRRFQMLPGEKMDFDIGDVPAADRALIEQALKKRGITPSDEKILDLYTQKVSR